MDELTFISSLAKSLAWPGTISIIVLLFRRRIGGLLARIIELKYNRLSVKLQGASEILKRAEREVRPRVKFDIAGDRPITPPSTHAAPYVDRPGRPPIRAEPAAERPSFRLAAKADPTVFFETTWQTLNTALLRRAGLTKPRRPDVMVAQLVESGALPREFQLSFGLVHAIYSAAQRKTGPIDRKLARDFARACASLMEYLQ